MSIDPGEPAFPTNDEIYDGLRVREYFAIKIMAAMVSRGQEMEYAASRAVVGADLLIAELNKEDSDAANGVS